VSVSQKEKPVTKTVSVFVVKIMKKIFNKFTMLNKLSISNILTTFMAFQLKFPQGDVLVKNLNVRKNIVNAIVLDSNALRIVTVVIVIIANQK
jgi:hypothetical protein